MDQRCGCPIYKEYRVNGKRFRRSAKTRNWQLALAKARKEELEGIKPPKTASPTIEQATEKYIADAQARQLREPTVYKLRLLFRQLNEFATQHGLVYISDFTLDNLRQFRGSWTNRNVAARVKLGNLKRLFRFCHQSKWIADNPAGICSSLGRLSRYPLFQLRRKSSKRFSTIVRPKRTSTHGLRPVRLSC